MVFLNLDNFNKKLLGIQEGLKLESSTLSVVFSKCKTKLPNNKFMNKVNKVQKQLKKISKLDFTDILNMENDQDSSQMLDWNQALQVCISWGRVAISTSDDCLIAFAHCEQNIKIGHFVMFYVSMLAILARLHAFLKVLCLTLGQLAYEIKVELEKEKQPTNLILKDIEKELLKEFGFSNDYEGLLQNAVPEDIRLSVCPEDLGEPVSRVQSEKSQPEGVTRKSQSRVAEKLKGANSVRALRLACKSEQSALSAGAKQEVEEILQKTDSICKSLLDAKRLVIQQSAEVLTSLLTGTKNEHQKYFLVDCHDQDLKYDLPMNVKENGQRQNSGSIDKLSVHMKELLDSLPCRKKIQKLRLSSLSNVCAKEKKRLLQMITTLKPKLLALKQKGQLTEYKTQVDILIRKVKEVVSTGKVTDSQGYLPVLDSSEEIPLLDISQEDAEESVPYEEVDNKTAFEKILKSCKTVDGLLDVWNDVIANEREDLTALLPSKTNKSKLKCVRKNILKLKTHSSKQKFKTIVRKISSYLYK